MADQPKSPRTKENGILIPDGENVYVLELCDGKWYIGKSLSTQKRIGDHIIGEGSEWTKKYRVLKVDSIISVGEDPFVEDTTTKKYMMKYGIDNVRGGSYCNVVLPDWQLLSLKREIYGATNKCFICGDSSHFAKFHSPGNFILQEGYVENTIDQEIPIIISPNVECLRCGRKNHSREKCYAKTHSNGEILDMPSKRLIPNKTQQKNFSDETTKILEEGIIKSLLVEFEKLQITDTENGDNVANDKTLV